jgi:hypothetical protein
VAGYRPELQLVPQGGKSGRAPDLKNREWLQAKEEFAMSTRVSWMVGPKLASSVNRLGRGARREEDSPYAPYLRSWMAHQAAQHRALLRNIDAAARIGLAPVIIPH